MRNYHVAVAHGLDQLGMRHRDPSFDGISLDSRASDLPQDVKAVEKWYQPSDQPFESIGLGGSHRHHNAADLADATVRPGLEVVEDRTTKGPATVGPFRVLRVRA